MAAVTFQQFIDFFKIPKDKADSILADLEAKYPDGAATIHQIQEIAAQYVTLDNISVRMTEALLEGWNALRTGKGPARVNPTSHFV